MYQHEHHQYDDLYSSNNNVRRKRDDDDDEYHGFDVIATKHRNDQLFCNSEDVSNESSTTSDRKRKYTTEMIEAFLNNIEGKKSKK